MNDRLPSIKYSPPDTPTLFDLWAAGSPTPIPAPLACRDRAYRQLIIGIIKDLAAESLASLISVGAGTGILENKLQESGLDVLATDVDASAVRMCISRGLRAARLDLLSDRSNEQFDIVYCDGVLGHLWQTSSRCMEAWSALAALAAPGAHAVVSNDLADDDQGPQFHVRSDTAARFYRPPAGAYIEDAHATGRWRVSSNQLYTYTRGNIIRRREILTARLLMHDGIEA